MKSQNVFSRALMLMLLVVVALPAGISSGDCGAAGFFSDIDDQHDDNIATGRFNLVGYWLDKSGHRHSGYSN